MDQLLLLVLLIVVVWTAWRLFSISWKLNTIDNKLRLLKTDETFNERSLAKPVSNLSQQQTALIMQLIRRYIEEEKPFLDPRFKMSKMCDALKINRTYLSEVLKKETGERFENFVNGYRIVYAIELLATDTHEKWLFTLDYYAKKAGFSSKSTFNRSFKQFTDLHPSLLQRVYLEDEAALKSFVEYFDKLKFVHFS